MVVDEIESPVGVLVAGVTDGGVCMLEFRDREIFETQLAKIRARVGPAVRGLHPRLDQLREELAEYFEGGRTDFALPLVYPGSPFQLRVWNALRAIPFGGTISYGELARRIGDPKAMRAVGAANGRNPIPIIVPCHRVIGADGSLTGFGGGLERKRWLLAHEGVGRELPLEVADGGRGVRAS
jgi:O-6-methylguanine DNA methyltransferase